MYLLPFVNFLVQYFLQVYIRNVVVFNCWDLNSQLQFLRNASDNLLRIQMVDIDKDFQFPGDYLNGALSTLGVVLDFNCNKSVTILNKSSELQLFVAKHKWLIFDENYEYSIFREQFEDTMMAVDAEITYAAFNNSTNLNGTDAAAFILYDVYNNGKLLGGKLNITVDKRVTCKVSDCVTDYLSDLHLRSKYGNRCNLNDTTFRISTVITEIPLNASTETITDFLMTMDTESDVIPKHGFHIVVNLQDIMNYKAKYIFTNAWSYNETGGGSFGAITTGEAELGSSGFYQTLPRLKYATGIIEIGDFRSVFMFRTPHNEGLYGGVFLSPFSPPVWLAFCFVIAVFAFVLWVIFAVEFRLKQYLMFIPSVLSTFLISFGLACIQSAALIPHTTGGRMAFLSLSAVTFIMYNYYTSTVVSSLVGSPLKSNIKTVGQLADSSLEIGMDPVAYTVAYLKIAPTADVKKYVKKKLSGRTDLGAPYWMKIKDGVLKARDGGFAYNAEVSTAYRMIEKYYQQHELCDLNEILLRTENVLVTLMAKQSRYKEIVRLSSIRMLETGVISKHRRYWMKTKLDCFSNTVLINVGLEYTGPLFVFLGTIYIVVLVILVMEVICFKYVSR